MKTAWSTRDLYDSQTKPSDTDDIGTINAHNGIALVFQFSIFKCMLFIQFAYKIQDGEH